MWRPPCVATFLAVLFTGCGSGGQEDASPAPTPTAARDAKPETEATPTPAVGIGAATGTGDNASTDTTPIEPQAEAHPGPCKISWSDGAVLRFRYTKTGGSVTVDQDGDGNRDVCGRFRRSDDRTTSVTVDLECDKKSDLTIRPKYAKDANLAEATYSITTDGETTKRSVTLVTMPSFSGLDPGFPLPAKRKDIELSVRDDVVQRARIKEPNDGRSDLTIEFVYDDDGRIKRITEDGGSDGTTEREFSYSYDDHGNVTRVRARAGEQKRSARIDYSCWK